METQVHFLKNIYFSGVLYIDRIIARIPWAFTHNYPCRQLDLSLFDYWLSL